MKISTTIATHYLLRLVFLVALPCMAFALWGAYDLWIKYPHQRWTNELHDAHRELLDKQEDRTISATRPAEARLIDLADHAVDFTGERPPTEVELLAVFEQLTQRYERTAKPSTFDDVVCWLFISCILMVPWAGWRVYYLRAHRFGLDEEGLHLPDGTLWSHEEVASIDMSRWMEKSIAWVVHRDGRRCKMDAYLYKNLEQVIGSLAHRFEPAQWNPDGTMVKSPAEEEAADGSSADSFAAVTVGPQAEPETPGS